MVRLTLLVLTLAIFGRDPIEEQSRIIGNRPAFSRSLEERLIPLKPGTPRSEALQLMQLTERLGAKKTSYFATLCGSMEEWVTPSGDQLYLQGSFFDQDGYREEPYIVAILRRDPKSNQLSQFLWSGPNLQTGNYAFGRVKAKR